MKPKLLSTLVSATLVGAITIPPASATGVAPYQPFCATDGSVYTMAQTKTRIYIGGSFTYVGPPTGGGVQLSPASAKPMGQYSFVNGWVQACAPDGSGGWYIGGSFTNVGGQSRNNLAHVQADGTVAPWNPGTDNNVTSLMVVGGVVYVGGTFTRISSEAWHPGFAALDGVTGALVQPWAVLGASYFPIGAMTHFGHRIYIGGDFTYVGAPTGGWAVIDRATGAARAPLAAVQGGTIYAQASDGAGGWYIGGQFSSVRGLPRGNLAHILADGSVDPWNPGAGGPVGSAVYAVAVSNGTVYVGGNFTSAGHATHYNLAAIDAGTGNSTSWPCPCSGYPETDGTVYALAVASNKVYVGGDFTTIGGRITSGLTAVDAGTGIPTSWYPGGSGIRTIVLRGGLVYIGGQFGQVGSTIRHYIAAVDTLTGQPTFWNPSADGPVYAIAPAGDFVYVGGAFGNIGGAVRHHVAALNLSNGAAVPWDPSADDTVRAIATANGHVYVGGDFASIGGQSRVALADIDSVSGGATAWSSDAGAINPTVYALAATGTSVVVGGSFAGVGGAARRGLAACDADRGTVLAWNPNGPGIEYNYTNAIATDGTQVYLGGSFTTIGGQPRNHIAAVDASAGALAAWDPGARSEVDALAMSGSTLFVGGAFDSIGGQKRSGLAALDAASGSVLPWNPSSAGLSYGVRSLATTSGLVYAIGSFTSIGGQPRNGAAAIDAGTGLPTAWSPPRTNGSPLALGATGSAVYIGGTFTSVGGASRYNIAAIDASADTVLSWDPHAYGPVTSVATAGGQVYVAGTFTNVGGQDRSLLAAVDTATGLATAWNPQPAGYTHAPGTAVNALVASGNLVYVGGNFASIGGSNRADLAALDAGTGAALFWAPDPNRDIYAIAVEDTAVVVGGAFTSLGGGLRNSIAAIDPVSGAALAWNPSGNAPVRALAVGNGVIYAGGDFTNVGGQTRGGLAALDSRTGLATAWNPTPIGLGAAVKSLAVSSAGVLAGGTFSGIGGQVRSRIAALDAGSGLALGWDPGADSTVRCISISGSKVCLGGDFGAVSGFATRSLALLSDPATTGVTAIEGTMGRALLSANRPNPFRVSSVVRLTLPRDGAVTLGIYDVSGRLVRSVLKRVAMTAGVHDVALDGSGLRGGVYWCRIEMGGAVEARKIAIVN